MKRNLHFEFCEESKTFAMVQLALQVYYEGIQDQINSPEKGRDYCHEGSVKFIDSYKDCSPMLLGEYFIDNLTFYKKMLPVIHKGDTIEPDIFIAKNKNCEYIENFWIFALEYAGINFFVKDRIHSMDNTVLILSIVKCKYV